MRTGMFYASVLLLCLACSSSCIRKPGRPNAELCTWQNERSLWECEDAFENVRIETNHENLAATTWSDYLILEKYIDGKESRVRQLERELSQCRR